MPSGFDPEFIAQPFPHRTFHARLFYMSSVANPDTHMFECKAEVDLRQLDVELSPGDMARIRFPIRTNPNATIIPEESVRATERGFVVFEPVQRLGRNGETEWIAKARTVERGASSEGWVEVRHGVAPGQWIVRRGAEALEDGTPIRIPESQLLELETAH